MRARRRRRQRRHTDPARLTSLVLLGVRDDKTFPLIFYRDNCADGALDESDIDEAFIASAKAIVVTGTHFSRPHTAAAQKLAMAYAKKHGRKIAIDIDYRPNLWGLAGHDAGFERYVKSEAVSESAAGDPGRLRPHRRHRGEDGRSPPGRRRRSKRCAPSGR
jgi:sugar/nucleoside kinase (ribokinase family)